MDKPTSDQDKVEYEVGYGKPPKTSQFKPGQSGNRKGRPKGSQNFATVLEKELNSTVTVTEGGRRKQIRKREVIAKQVVNKAAAGDLKATSLLMTEARNVDASSAVNTFPAAPTEFAHADQLTLQSIIARIRASAPDENATRPDAANPEPPRSEAFEQPSQPPTEPFATVDTQPGVSS